MPFQTSLAKIYEPSFSEYLPLLTDFQEVALKSKLDLSIVFDTNHRSRFEALTSAQKLKLIERLTLINELLEGSVRVLGAHKSHFYLRAALKKFGWKVDPSTFEMIGEHDTVEIYGLDMALKIANMRFLQLCSYPLEDILSREFYELFNRDSEITKSLLGHWPKMMKREVTLVTDLGPDHMVSEAFSIRRNRFWVQSKVLAPVYGPGQTIVGPLYSASVNTLAANEKAPAMDV